MGAEEDPEKTSQREHLTDPEPYLAMYDFEYEIFFSYAHGTIGSDREPPLKEWSRQLKEALADDIDTILQTRTRIFFDGDGPTGTDGTVPLREDIDSKVAGSALFHLVMSPHYLDSTWCRDELEKFVEALPPGPGRTKDRIFVSKAMDTSKMRWPDSLHDERGSRLSGWNFFPKGGERPYGYWQNWKIEFPSEIRTNFFRLSDAMIRALRNLKDNAIKVKSQKARYAEFHRGEIRRIYLYGRSEDLAAWQAARVELEKLGIEIWPDAPEPLDIEEDRERYLDHCRSASRCDAMLMVAASPDKFDDDLEVVGRSRRQLIDSKYKKYLPCAVLDRAGAVRTPARRELAERFDIDWLDIAVPDWPDAFRRWLRTSGEKLRRRDGLPPIDPEGHPS